MTTVDITCPTCGTVSYFEELGRDAGAFCRVCDFPLFWVRATRFADSDGADGDTGLRRLPGTAGRIALATLDCPTCTEPNPVNGVICIRCGNPLHPAPPAPVTQAVLVPVPVYVPPPPPLPPPEIRILWPWILVSIMGVVAIALLIGLTVN